MASRRLNIVLDLDTGGYSGKLATAGGQMKSFGGNVNKAAREMQSAQGKFTTLGGGADQLSRSLRENVLALNNMHLALVMLNAVAVTWVVGMVKQSAEVERLTVLMEGLSHATSELGKQTEAKDSMSALFDMARKSGYAVKDVANSFVKMKSARLNPMDGSLDSLLDASAFSGATSEQMHRAGIAIQQMAGKGVISMEELRQQLGEAIPTAMADMARAMNMSVPDFSALVAEGKVQAKPALEAMFKEWEVLYAGAGERMSETMLGQVNTFKTNMMDVSTAFTQQGDKRGFYESVLQGIKDLNAALASSEGKQAIADIGTAVGGVAKILIDVIKWVVHWREELWAAAKVVVGAFLLIKGVNMAKWFLDMATIGVASFKKIGQATTPLGGWIDDQAKKVNALSNSYVNLSAVEQLRQRRAQSAVSTANQNIAFFMQESAQLKNREALLEKNNAALHRQWVTQGQALDRAKLLHAANLADGRSSANSARMVKAAQDQLNNTTERLYANRRILATTTKQVHATEAMLVAETNLATAATSRLSAATGVLTVKQRLQAAAARTGAVVMRGFSLAVNAALGPLGLIAFALYEAANAFGVFENRAKRAADAATAAIQGMASAEHLSDLLKEKASLQNDIDLAKKVGKNSYQTGYRGAANPQEFIRLREQQLANNAANTSLARSSVLKASGNDYAGGLEVKINERKRNNAAAYKADVDAYENGKISKGQLDARRARYNADTAAFSKTIVDSLYKTRSEKGANTAQIDGMIERIEGATGAANDLADASGNMAAQVAKGGDAAGGAEKKLTAAEKAADRAAKANERLRDKYADMSANLAGDIAGMKEELLDGEGALASFEAKLAGGLYDGINDQETAKLREQFATIDTLNERLTTKRGADRLKKDLAEAAIEADNLWSALNSGFWDLNVRASQVRTQFAGMLEGIKDPEALDAMKTRIEEIVTQVQRADAADVVRDWQQMSEQTRIDLLDENAAREANFQREIERMSKLIDWNRLTASQRIQAEAAYFEAIRTMQQKLARDNEGATVKMMRDWMKLGKNMDQTLAGSIDNFVNSLAEGKFAFGDFVKELVVGLLKVILKAVIAFAIMSALGMTNGQSMGDFMKSGFSDFGGGFNSGPGVDTNASTASANGAINGGIKGLGSGGWGVDAHHTGGWIGSGALKAGEVPIVGMEGEPVLSPAQASFYGKAFEAAIAGKNSPTVQVNVINNSGQDLNAEQGQTEFDGDSYIIGVIVDAANKQGPLRDTLQSMKKG